MSKIIFMIPSVDVVASDDDSDKITATILINGNPFEEYTFAGREALDAFTTCMQRPEFFEALCGFHKAKERSSSEAQIKKILDAAMAHTAP